jgi:hypothetical protein
VEGDGLHDEHGGRRDGCILCTTKDSTLTSLNERLDSSQQLSILHFKFTINTSKVILGGCARPRKAASHPKLALLHAARLSQLARSGNYSTTQHARSSQR